MSRVMYEDFAEKRDRALAAEKTVRDQLKLLEKREAAIDELTKERDELRAVVEKYADRDNWGYYDDSGCSKGHGSSTDACFIGPEVAEAALAATQSGGAA